MHKEISKLAFAAIFGLLSANFAFAEIFEVSETIKTSGFERDDKKQVVIDYEKNLMWQDDESAKTVSKNWHEAIEYCKNLNFAGFSNWRLPEMEELESIYDNSKTPAIHSTFNNFNNFRLNYYWSSTTYAGYTGFAWIVYASSGSTSNRSKSNSNYVRRVRGGQFDLFEALKEKKFSKLYDLILDKTMSSFPKPPLQTELTKDEFEKQSEFEKRVEATKKANTKAVEKYKKEYQAFYPKAKKEAMQKALEMFYGKPVLTDLKYDAENELFGARLTFENNRDLKHNIVIKIPSSEAKAFKDSFKDIKKVALFDFDGSSVTFKTVKFENNKKTYTALLTDKSISSNAIQVAKLDTNIGTNALLNSDINIKQGASNTFDTSSLVSTNDLDELLEKAQKAKTDNKKWLFAVGVENYKYTDNIIFAKRSAEMFAKVMQKTLGVPAQNSIVLLNENATAAEIKNKMKLFLRNVKDGDTIYFYYNGHGVPAVDKQNEPFILSSDPMPDFASEEPSFMMKQIYKGLSSSKAKQIVAVIDSCFSGSTDGKSIQKGVAAAVLKPKAIDFDKSKMVVLTAGKDIQYSNAYAQKAHRMFSYFVMEEILKGQKDIKELYGKVYKNTKETTRANFGDMRVQEPQLDGNVALGL